MAWTWYTLTVFVTEEQQRRLEAITEAMNRQRGEGEKKTDTAAAFDLIMQTGMAHVIDERLKMCAQFYGIETAQDGQQGGPAAPI